MSNIMNKEVAYFRQCKVLGEKVGGVYISATCSVRLECSVWGLEPAEKADIWQWGSSRP